MHRADAMPLRRTCALGVLVLTMLSPGIVAHAATDPAMLVQEGSSALDAGRFADALEAFTRAAAIVPRDPSPCAGAGLAAFMLGRNDDAKDWFERALRLNPQYLTASEWLGELQHRTNNLQDAIATYEAALTFAPGTEPLASRLAAWRKEAQHQSRTYESRGAHFSVRFEGPSDDTLARRTVERLEEAYWRIGQALSTYPQERITVVLYTQEQFRDITRLPAWTAGAYDGRIHVPMRGALDHTEELDRVLGHELVHAIVAMLGGRAVPVWVNEGLATLLEPGGREEAEQVLAHTDARPALSRLHGSFSTLSAEDARVAYAVSTRAVRRMIELQSASRVVLLLKALARGTPFATAFHQQIGMRYDDFQAMIARE